MLLRVVIGVFDWVVFGLGYFVWHREVVVEWVLVLVRVLWVGKGLGLAFLGFFVGEAFFFVHHGVGVEFDLFVFFGFFEYRLEGHVLADAFGFGLLAMVDEFYWSVGFGTSAAVVRKCADFRR